jgi:hypothetical protein
MLRSIITVATFAAIALTSPAYAKKEVQVTRTVYELSDFPELEAKAKAICANEKLGKSDRLKRACNESQFPRVTKAGAFWNTGYGAELNTLIRQP